MATVFSPAAACTAAHQGTRPCRSTRQRWSASSTDSRRGPRSVKTFTSNPDPDAPPYQVAASKALYELRIYGAYYVTRAGYSNREQGLASLMGYVEGGNERGTVFPATQPLIMRYADSESGDGEFEKTMELSLGANVTDPPAPTTPGVCVAAAGGELVAVIGFEGIATPELALKYRAALTSAVESDGLTLANENEFRLATHGQLYSLKPRLNELMIQVKLA